MKTEPGENRRPAATQASSLRRTAFALVLHTRLNRRSHRAADQGQRTPLTPDPSQSTLLPSPPSARLVPIISRRPHRLVHRGGRAGTGSERPPQLTTDLPRRSRAPPLRRPPPSPLPAARHGLAPPARRRPPPRLVARPFPRMPRTVHLEPRTRTPGQPTPAHPGSRLWGPCQPLLVRRARSGIPSFCCARATDRERPCPGTSSRRTRPRGALFSSRRGPVPPPRD